jgi:hypothetical protein
MAQYTLPNIEMPIGTVKVRLDAVAGLTVPTFQTFLGIGDLVDYADIKPGIQQVSTLEISLVDSYDAHVEGFWLKAIAAGEVKIRLLLVENGADTFLFYGRVDPLSLTTKERYVGSDQLSVREIGVTLVSLESTIFDVLVDDLVTEMLAQAQTNGIVLYHHDDAHSVIRIQNIFACLLHASGLNSTYAVTDVSFVSDGVFPDLAYINGASATEYSFDELFMVLEYWLFNHDSGAGQSTTGYTDLWSTTYKESRELISNILKTFCLVMKFDYDIANDRILIKLYQRGRAFANLNTFGSPTESSTVQNSDLLVDAVQADLQLSDPALFVWFSARWKGLDNAQVSAIVPEYVKIDASFTTIFRTSEVVDKDIALLSRRQSFYPSTAADGEEPQIAMTDQVISVKYWDYSIATPAYITADTGDAECHLQEAVAGYHARRFAGVFEQITRVYPTIQSTREISEVLVTSHTLSHALMRTEIGYGAYSKHYYANKVIKNIETQKLTVEWIQE